MASSNSSTDSTSELTPIMTNITPYTPCMVKNFPPIRFDFHNGYTMDLCSDESDHELFICLITFERNGERFTDTIAFMVFKTISIEVSLCSTDRIIPSDSLVIARLFDNTLFDSDNQTCILSLVTLRDVARFFTTSSPLKGYFVSGKIYRSPYSVKQHRLVNPVITSTDAIFCLDFFNPQEFVDYFEEICQPRTTKSAAKI